MVPSDLATYFEVSSGVAGTLIGLLFVAISLRYDVIFGSARHRAIAAAAFISLANALSLSLWALMPKTDLGYPAAATAVLSLVATWRIHVGQGRRRDTSVQVFAFSVLVYLLQLVGGILLVSRPHESTIVFDLAYTVFGAFLAGLTRSWTLLQFRTSDDDQPPASAPAVAGD